MYNPEKYLISPKNYVFLQKDIKKQNLSLEELKNLRNQLLKLKQDAIEKKQEFMQHIMSSDTEISKKQNRKQNQMGFSSQQISQKNQSFHSQPPISQKGQVFFGQNQISQKNQTLIKTQNSEKIENPKKEIKDLDNEPDSSIDTRIDMKENDELWENTNIFFRGLPKLFQLQQILEKSSKLPDDISSDSSIPYYEIWTDKFTEIARKRGLMIPPPLKTNEDGLNKFWQTKQIPFQIEKSQKKVDSKIQRLINALVESPPIERANKDVKLPVGTRRHILAPIIPYSPYLALDFEQKIELELESLGLNSTGEASQATNFDNCPFSREIEAYKLQLQRIIPRIDELKNEILLKMPEVIEKDKEMKEARENFMAKYVKPQTK